MTSDAAMEAGPRAWVLVAGTGSSKPTRAQTLAARAVGRALARRGFGLVTGGWVGVDKEVTQAFAEVLQAMGTPLSRSLKQIVPRPDQPAFFGGDVIYVDKGPQEWVETVKRAQAVILIGGRTGTYRTYEAAQNELVPVFPLPGTGSNARKAFDQLLEDWPGTRMFRHVQRDEMAALDSPIDSKDAAEDAVDRLMDLLVEEVSGRHAPRLARPRPARTTKEGTARERIDFLLVTALPEERDALLRRLGTYEKVPPRRDDVHVYFRADLGAGDGEEAYRLVVLPLLGMGRVNAATATADAIKRWRPRHVILVGIAGGVAARSVSLGDLLISEQVVDYELQKITEKGVEVRWSVQKASRRLYAAALNLIGDAWTARIEEKRPEAGKPRIHLGPIASGDKVVAARSVLAEYSNVWPSLIGVEMEAAGVASACFAAARQPEFFMIRGVSDLADGDKNTAAVDAWRPYACDVAATYAIELLKSRPIPPARAKASTD
jgi:nucleoside phosphorylase/predicted Rossmann-fold nucleotide-binding protein